MSEVLLQVEDLKKYYPLSSSPFSMERGYVKAVDGVSFTINAGETMGLVGESGCGKTTIGRTLLRLYDPTGGKVIFGGKDIFKASRREMNHLRAEMQMIFQDPYSSLNPRIPVQEAIAEAVRVHKIVPDKEVKDYVIRVMEDCGLQARHKDRYPHEFSGGQRQRVCIARALALKPKFIVCDEPVSALDVSIQAQIINLLKDLQKKYNMSYLFISHDLSVVQHISDKIGVMYLGNMVEYGSKCDVFENPGHPYTQALISAVPMPDPKNKMKRIILEGDVPSPANPPKGCPFHPRCSKCRDLCRNEKPQLQEVEPGHFVACHLCTKENCCEGTKG